MFYSGWSSIRKGNINLAYSKNLKQWNKIEYNLFDIDDDITIVSEPFVYKLTNQIKIFFEYKNPSGWDLGSTSINSKKF